MMNVKNQKGITLTALIIYITAMLMVVGILASISSFFHGNLGILKKSANYAAQFDIFNSYMIGDVKNNKDVKVDGYTVIFEDGTTYVYEGNSLYRGQEEVATNVTDFEVSKKTITINNVDKNILRIKLTLGNSSKTLFNKNIDYTLKYW